ncbi:hypothetical protein [Ornithinibacillus halophilus]|uniref:hypothetical protein n=1 Tax=Ornithinibacillus halophilus TaxID=930117 RepID=UPI001F37EB93|nr:hypothetical protein [Ornithinibacillus halophilus]
MKNYYNPEVKYLLLPKSDKKESILYNKNEKSWDVPAIGPRPPYYTNPIYKPYYPSI